MPSKLPEARMIAGIMQHEGELVDVEIPASAMAEDAARVLDKVKALGEYEDRKAGELYPHQKESLSRLNKSAYIDSLFGQSDVYTNINDFASVKDNKHRDDRMIIIPQPKLRDRINITTTITGRTPSIPVFLELPNRHGMTAKYDSLKERSQRMMLSHEGMDFMELESRYLGKWHEPTKVRLVNGVAEFYYELLPTVLSVQIALLCGFELKQTIKRVTEKQGHYTPPELSLGYDPVNSVLRELGNKVMMIDEVHELPKKLPKRFKNAKHKKKSK